MRLAASVLFAFQLSCGIGRAADEVDYLKDLKPILTSRCIACHGPLKQQSQLRLDSAAGVKQGGVSGRVVEVGKSTESLLIEHLTGANGAVKMPPEGEPLSAEQIELFRKWIDQGAKSPPDEPVADPSRHWAFVAPVRPILPAVQPDRLSNPVDLFINAELHQRGLQPACTAPRHVLLRRVYLDLIGLPPSRDELQAFLNDTSPDAYEKAVDRLLASPHYGERWGRHWMDVWRYSDWDGYGAEVRESQPHIWRWRDWIVESLNSDKPYSDMVVEMLAGDEVAPDDPQTIRATGFLVRNWFKFNRNIWLDNTVEHTCKAFLGLTVNCARCHDHKFDPVSQSDYYSLRAFFEPYDIRTDRLPGRAAAAGSDPLGLVRVYDAGLQTPTYLFERGDDKHPDKDHPLTPTIPGLFARNGHPLPAISAVEFTPEVYYPGLKPFLQEEALALAAAETLKAESLVKTAEQSLLTNRQRSIDLASTASVAPMHLADDDFKTARPDLWINGAGEWVYADGRLKQVAVSEGASQVTLKQSPPQDFSATFKFRINGGKQWKSVGLSFDRTDENNSSSVYLSAYAGGPKLQVWRRVNGQDAYPPEAAKAIPVELNQDQELRILVRGTLMNVVLDGKLLLVYTLPARAAGSISLWTFDAQAEFLQFTLAPLAPNAALAAAEGQPVLAVATLESAALDVSQAETALKGAELALDVARHSQAAVQARIAADKANYSKPPAVDAQERALAAGKAERELAAAQAGKALHEAVLKLEQSRLRVPASEALKKVLTDAEAAVAVASKLLEEKQAAIAPPSATYTRISIVYPASSSGRRLALARWISGRNNPLTARVAVNHLWLRHFGQPLVSSVFDFGHNGKRPTHPQLLDWLAVEFMDNGWKMKPIHRLIVTSETYRRTSSVPADATFEKHKRLDAENTLLWRTNVRRMEAETLRDSTLCVAGSLDRTPSGTDLDQALGLQVPRRSLYFRSAKEKRMTFLALFDSANVSECYRRSESIVPQQALAMANSPLALAQSRVLAQRLTVELAPAGGDPSGASGATESDARFIRTAFEQILCRPPTADEQSTCLSFLGQQTEQFVSKSKLTPFTSGEAVAQKPSENPHQRARENLIHVLLNHNDFVTIR